MIDKVKRDALISKIGDLGSGPEPLVTVEEFFTGNDDPGSIWCNYPDAPPPSEIFLTLKEIENRGDVASVWIAINQYDEDQLGYWPYSEKVVIVTSAAQEEIPNWFPSGFEPDDYLNLAEANLQTGNLKEIPNNMRVVIAWWD